MTRYTVTRNDRRVGTFNDSEIHDALALFHRLLAEAQGEDDDVTVTLEAESLFM